MELRKSKLSFDLLVIDDFSTDETLESCLKLQSKFEELRIVHLNKNQRQRNATALGYNLAKGKYVVTFDDDLQYSPREISLLYEKILESNQLIISGFSSFTGEKKWYKTLKKTIFLSFNYLFFPRFKNSKYITSLKIYNKDALNKTSLINIYYFWEIDPSSILTVRVEKNIGLRLKSKYNFKAFVILLAPLILKVFAKSGFAISLSSLMFATILGHEEAYNIFLISFLLSVCFVLLTYWEKGAFLRVKYKIY